MPKPDRTLYEILGVKPDAKHHEIGIAFSRRMSGDSKPVGIAFAIDNGVMVTSCHGIAPGALLTVKINPRILPARVSMTDEGLGLCKLDVSTAGTTPLAISGTEARAGDTV